MDININLNYNNNLKKINLNFFLIGILILGTFLRLYHLGFQGAWLDELHTLKEADPDVSFKEFNEVNMFREGIPHFYFLVVRFFGSLFTHSLYSIRLVSAIAGVLSISTIYLLGKEMVNKQMGYVAAFLLAIHPFLIEYSQEGRSYSLLVLFVILAFFRLLKFLKIPDLKNAVLLGLCSGLITNCQPIGILNVISIYLIIAICFFYLQSRKERINYIKLSFLSGIITLLVFLPVYQKVVNASKITSFWVPKATYENVLNVLTNLSGGNKWVLYFTLVALIALSIVVIIKRLKLVRTVDTKSKNQEINSILVFVWIFFFFAFIVIKSQGEASLMSNRYLISLVPAFILALAYSITLIKNNILKGVTISIIASLFFYTFIIEKKYYSTRVKSQFDEVSVQVKAENTKNETIVSNWGWLLSYYLDKDFTIKNVFEKNLDLYINDVKTKSVPEESFWYIDGHFRPYNVAPETQEFIDANYEVDKNIELHDAWAKHYKSRKRIDNNLEVIKLNKFINAQIDTKGDLMFFQNSRVKYPPFNLESGDYEISVFGNSLPNKPINGENAKMNIYINNSIFKTITLSEKSGSEIKLPYTQSVTQNITLELEFINDFSDKLNDRNIQISNIKFLKLK